MKACTTSSRRRTWSAMTVDVLLGFRPVGDLHPEQLQVNRRRV
jgi:hypothetical protein